MDTRFQPPSAHPTNEYTVRAKGLIRYCGTELTRVVEIWEGLTATERKGAEIWINGHRDRWSAVLEVVDE